MIPPFANPRAAFLFHLLALLVFLGLWTWKLIEPVQESLPSKFSADARFIAAKGLHAGGYCFLTLLAVTLPVPSYWRWLFAGLLALHGVATEIGQMFVPGRGGSVRDALIDWLGIALGVLVWRVWRSVGHSLRE